MGNLMSVSNALACLGYRARVTNDRADLAAADAFILPGVGAFGEAMDRLNGLGIVELLSHSVLAEGRPLLGICLGMQLLCEHSTELGTHDGLGWLEGRVERIPELRDSRLPHVGWNNVRFSTEASLFADIAPDPNYYFDHSYHAQLTSEVVMATTSYAGGDIVAAIQKRNIMATQFHPEKSQRNGLRLLRNFLNYVKANTT